MAGHTEEIPLPAKAGLGTNRAVSRTEDLQPDDFLLKVPGGSHEMATVAAAVGTHHSFDQ